jgi:hypothetical protein
MEMYYWFKDPNESIIIVSPYYEGETVDKLIKSYE